MARYDLEFPDLGHGIADAELVAWCVAVGDRVTEDQDVADMRSGEWTFSLAAPCAGRVVALKTKVGERRAIGEVMAVFERARARMSPALRIALKD